MENSKPSTSWPDALRKRADDLEREALAARHRGAPAVCIQALEKELARVEFAPEMRDAAHPWRIYLERLDG